VVTVVYNNTLIVADRTEFARFLELSYSLVDNRDQNGAGTVSDRSTWSRYESGPWLED
jgi:hypothetical protein